jgi:hypothetical protein
MGGTLKTQFQNMNIKDTKLAQKTKGAQKFCFLYPKKIRPEQIIGI